MSDKGTILGHINPIPHDADGIDYSNASSGLVAKDVQAAIDEVKASIPAPVAVLWDRAGTTLSPHTANDNVDLGSGNISTTGTVDGRDVSVDGSTLDDHLDGTGSKHDASEIDVEGTYTNIPGTPMDLESTVAEIDAGLGTIVTDHGSLTGLGDDDHTQYTQKATLTTKGDMYVRGDSTVERLALGTSGQYMKVGASSLPEWATVSMPTVPNREIVVSSGGSAAVNTAITTLNGLGGGTVRLDGMIDMDGDITMKSNVTMEGYGFGTGLRNNTANAYKINFIGTTPTYYGIAAPTHGADSFTCDTAAQAGNFTANTYVILKCTNSLTSQGDFLKVKVNGDTGTGAVKIYGCQYNLVGFMDATTEAAPLTGAVENCGMRKCCIDNTSSGSITIECQYAANITFWLCNIFESKFLLHECGSIVFHTCTLDVRNDLSFSKHIEMTYWVYDVLITNCDIRNAEYGIYWVTTYTNIQRIKIDANRICCYYGIYLYGNTKSSVFYMDVTGNESVKSERAASGGGNATFFQSRATTYYCTFVHNLIVNASANYQIYMLSVSYLYNYYLVVSNNVIDSSISIDYLANSAIIGNTVSSMVLDNGPQNNSITGNAIFSTLYMRDSNTRQVLGNSISGNSFKSAIYFDGDSTRPFENNTFSGNRVDGVTYCSAYHIKNVFSGNTFKGNVNLTTNAGETWGKNSFCNNFCGANVTFTEANQSDNIIVGNLSDTAITTLTGSNNEVAHNVVY